jgi:hypothetical protein
MRRRGCAQADCVSRVMSLLRVERDLIWTGPRAVRVNLGQAALIVLACALFACSFVVGKTSNASNVRTQPPAILPAASVNAAVPLGLSGAPPIELPQNTSARAPQRPQSSPSVVQTPKVSVTPATQAVTRAPQSAPRPAPAPRTVLTPRQPASPPPVHHGSPGGSSPQSPQGGGSFDSSG